MRNYDQQSELEHWNHETTERTVEKIFFVVVYIRAFEAEILLISTSCFDISLKLLESAKIKWFHFPVFTYFSSQCSTQIREWTVGLKSGSFINSINFFLKSIKFSCVGSANTLVRDLQYFKHHLFTTVCCCLLLKLFSNKDWNERNPVICKVDQDVDRIRAELKVIWIFTLKTKLPLSKNLLLQHIRPCILNRPW